MNHNIKKNITGYDSNKICDAIQIRPTYDSANNEYNYYKHAKICEVIEDIKTCAWTVGALVGSIIFPYIIKTIITDNSRLG